MTHPAHPVHPAPHTTLLLEPSSAGRARRPGTGSDRGCGPPARTPPPASPPPSRRRPTSRSFSSARPDVIQLGGAGGPGRRHAPPTPALLPGRHAPPAGRRTPSARRAAPSASRAERRPPPVNRLEAGSHDPSSASRAACKAIRASKASSQDRSCCDIATNVGQPGAVTAAGSASTNSATNVHDPGVVHTFTLRTYVLEVKV